MLEQMTPFPPVGSGRRVWRWPTRRQSKGNHMSENQKQEVVPGIKEVHGNVPGADGYVDVRDPNAVALAAKSYGKPKTLTPEERERRRVAMRKVTADRVARRQAQAPSPVPETTAPAEPGPVVPAPSSAPAPRPITYVSVGKPRSVAPSSRAYPARQTR